MQPIAAGAVETVLQQFAGKPVYLHLETTSGAYTEGAFGAFIRNGQVQLRRGGIRGTGPFRAGLELEHGFIYAEGLTDWEVDDQGRLLLAGHDKEGRLTVALELSLQPFPMGAGEA